MAVNSLDNQVQTPQPLARRTLTTVKASPYDSLRTDTTQNLESSPGRVDSRQSACLRFAPANYTSCCHGSGFHCSGEAHRGACDSTARRVPDRLRLPVQRRADVFRAVVGPSWAEPPTFTHPPGIGPVLGLGATDTHLETAPPPHARRVSGWARRHSGSPRPQPRPPAACPSRPVAGAPPVLSLPLRARKAGAWGAISRSTPYIRWVNRAPRRDGGA
jgi:hypothetical protein